MRRLAVTQRLLGSLKLVATRTAISCSRMFVAHTLEKWHMDSFVDDALLITDELIRGAVKATGTMDEHPDLENVNFIAMRLLGLETSIRIEVWDSAPSDPPLLPSAGSPVKRGSYLASGGKVVWAELSLLPPRRSPPLLPPVEQFRSIPDDSTGGEP